MATHGERSRRRDVGGDLERRRFRVVGEILDDPEPARLVGIDGTTREQEVPGRALAGQRGQAPDVAGAEMHAEAPDRYREPSGRHGDAQVPHATASCIPAPIAGPLTAAITGDG